MSTPLKPTTPTPTTATTTEAPVTRRGRPRVEDPMTRLSVRVPSPTYDRLAQRAIREDKSVASLVRQLLILRLLPPVE